MLKNMFNNLVKDKKKLALIILIIAILLIIITVTCIFLNNADKDSNKFKREYEQLNSVDAGNNKNYPEVKIPSKNVMKYSNVSEILTIFSSMGDAVIYFGYPSCLYCRSAIQVLCDTAATTSLDKIYYLNVENLASSDDYNKLIDILGEDFISEIDGKKNIYAPLVIFVVNGSIVSYNKGTLFSQEDPYVKLDNSQIEGLSEIYRYGINDVLDSINNKSFK